MKRILRYSALLVLFAFAVNAANTQAQSATQRYADLHKNTAAQLAVEFGIPREVIMGVAIVESSSGQGPNCRDLNNHFGIVGRNSVARHTRYKQYASVQESYRDFCATIARKAFYSRLKGNHDVTAWADAISKAGYSEQPTVWRQRIVSIMKTNRL